MVEQPQRLGAQAFGGAGPGEQRAHPQRDGEEQEGERHEGAREGLERATQRALAAWNAMSRASAPSARPSQ